MITDQCAEHAGYYAVQLCDTCADPDWCECECHWTQPGTITAEQITGMAAMFAATGLEGGAASEQSAFIRSVIGGDWDWMSQQSSLSREQAGDILYALSIRARAER